MTHYEKEVRRILGDLKKRGTPGAGEALAKFDQEKVLERLRAGVGPQECVVDLLVPQG